MFGTVISLMNGSPVINNLALLMRYIFLMVSLATLVSAAFAHEGATGIIKDLMGKFKESQLILKLMIKSAKVDDFEKIADMSSALHQWGSEMTDYFPAGSDGNPSEAAPAIWSDPEGFKAATTRFSKAALTITVAADAGDKASMMKAIKATAASCKACHSVYRLK